MATEKVVFEGGETLLRLLQHGGFDAELAVGAALYREANTIMNESQQQVPVKTGALKASGHVNTPIYVKSRYIEVKLGYGGAAAPYAFIVHENLDAHHPVGKAKYLEDPVMAHLDGILERVTRSVDLAMQKLGKF